MVNWSASYVQQVAAKLSLVPLPGQAAQVQTPFRIPQRHSGKLQRPCRGTAETELSVQRHLRGSEDEQSLLELLALLALDLNLDQGCSAANMTGLHPDSHSMLVRGHEECCPVYLSELVVAQALTGRLAHRLPALVDTDSGHAHRLAECVVAAVRMEMCLIGRPQEEEFVLVHRYCGGGMKNSTDLEAGLRLDP
jgi:hypothetical protein